MHMVFSDSLNAYMGSPGFRGSRDNVFFIFRELGGTDHYFRGGDEQTHRFGGLGSSVKKHKHLNEKASILFDFLKKIIWLDDFKVNNNVFWNAQNTQIAPLFHFCPRVCPRTPKHKGESTSLQCYLLAL